jgi:hypothetical protein
MERSRTVLAFCTVTATALLFASPIADVFAPSIEFALGAHSTVEYQKIGGVHGLVANGLSVVGALLTLISTLGLISLRSWSRVLAIVGAASLLASYVPVGEFSKAGASFAVGLASMGLWGAAIAIAYWSELRTQFR